MPISRQPSTFSLRIALSTAMIFVNPVVTRISYTCGCTLTTRKSLCRFARESRMRSPELEMYSRCDASQTSESMSSMLSSSRLIMALASAEVAVSRCPSNEIITSLSPPVRMVVVIWKSIFKCFSKTKVRISERNAKENLVFLFISDRTGTNTALYKGILNATGYDCQHSTL